MFPEINAMKSKDMTRENIDEIIPDVPDKLYFV
jgi:hypothetical protein